MLAMKSIQRVFQSLAAGFLALGTATARADPATDWQVQSLDVRPAANPAFARDVVIHFGGLPWTSYEVEAGDSLNHWTPVGRAAESEPGHFLLLDANPWPQQAFYRAVPVLPGPEKSFEAHYAAAAAALAAAIHENTLAYTFESGLGVENLALATHRQIEELGDALAGDLIVSEDPPGHWRVAWGGDEVLTADPAVRDQAVADFQAAAQQAAADQAAANALIAALAAYPPQLADATTLLVAERQAAFAEQQSIAALPLPDQPQFIGWLAPLAFFQLETLQARVEALDIEKTALQDSITRRRAEAQRKRTLAAQPVQLFGLNGVWHVRWAGLEKTFPTKAEAEAYRDGELAVVIGTRSAEAADLDAEADALEAQLPTLSAERDALAAGLPPAQAEAAARQAALGNTPVTDPTDLDDRRVKERFWIDFDSQYLDWKWTDMVTEWQRHKNNFRAILQSLGTSAAEIDKLERHWNTQEDIRRKWMRIFTGEPINLRLLFVNQFTGFTVDVENAVWEVVYQDHNLNREVRVQVGSGGELTLPPETAAGIWQEAKNREGTGGDTVVVELRVTYERVHADGTRERGYQDQQVIIESRTRAEDEAQRAALRDQTPRGVR